MLSNRYATESLCTKGVHHDHRTCALPVAGLVVLASLVAAEYVHPGFLWLTAFVGANLLQSAFTNWCPMMTVLRRAGLPPAERTAGG